MTPTGTNSFTRATKIPLGRLLLIPVFVACLAYRRPGLALAAFLVASLADAVDGYLARHRGETTSLGALLDPAADKLLILSAYAFMGLIGALPFWLAALVVGRDIVLSLGYAALYLSSGFQTPTPTLMGKAAAAAQMTAVLFALLAMTLGVGDARWLLPIYGITAALTAASGLHYVAAAVFQAWSRKGRTAEEKNTPGFIEER